MVTISNLQNGEGGIANQRAYETGSYPPAFLEYAWYLSVFYAMLGGALGIVIPLLGTGTLVLVAAGCFLSMGNHSSRVYRPVALALSTGILMGIIQLVFHEWSQRASAESIFIVQWLAMLIAAQPLSLRPGFLQRFALIALAIGITCLPFISLKADGGIMRATAVGTGMNANGLGMWFGFCTVYFIFWGLQSQKPILRAASWTTALGCFYVVALTVSRAPVLAIILAGLVGFRSALKRSFVPVLLLVLLISLIYVSGVFDDEINYYTNRGAEKTGRETLFTVAIERIIDSPWIGVGLGEIQIYRGAGKQLKNPHNGLLHITLGAGIIPLICFLGYLARVAIGSLRIMERVQAGEAALVPPLVAFALFEIMILDYTFMSPWTVVIFALAAGAIQAEGRRRSITA